MRKILPIIFKMLKLKGEKKQYISMIIALAMIVAIATAGGLIYKNAILNNQIALEKNYGKYGTYIFGEDHNSNLEIKAILEELKLNHGVLVYDPSLSWDEYPDESQIFYVDEKTYEKVTGFKPSKGFIALAGRDLQEDYEGKTVVLVGLEDNNFTIQGIIDTLPQIGKYMLLLPQAKEDIHGGLPQFFLVELNNSIDQFNQLKRRLDESILNKYTMESSIAAYRLQRKDLDNLETILFAVVILICLFSTVLLYIGIKQLLMEQSQLWFTLQTIGLSQRDVLLVMVLKFIFSLLLGIVAGGLLGGYLGILACRLTDTDIISLTPDFRYLMVSGITVAILFLLLLRWFKKNLVKSEIIQLIHKEKGFTNRGKEKKTSKIMEFTIPILLGLMVISGFIIDEKRSYLFGLAILLLLIWVVRSPNQYIGLFLKSLKARKSKILRLLGMAIENHQDKTAFVISALFLSIVLFISSVTMVSTLKNSGHRMVDNIISYDYAVITTEEDFILEEAKDDFKLMGRQLVLDGVANGSLNIKFVVTDMEDFKNIYKEASHLEEIKGNQLIASNFLMAILDSPIEVKVEGIKEAFNTSLSIESIDHNAQCVYLIRSVDDFKEEYLDGDKYTYYYLYESLNEEDFPKGDDYEVISINQIKDQWSEITSQGILPFQYFVMTVLLLVSIVFILHVRNMLLRDADEFALFTVMGMKKVGVKKLILLETVTTFAIALTLAIIIAIPFTLVTIMLLSELSNIKLSISFDFKLIGLYILGYIILLSILGTLIGQKISSKNCVDIFKSREVL